MKILQAIGLGIAILVLRLLMGRTFAAFEATAQAVFLFIQETLQRFVHIAPSPNGATMF